ncbi:Glucoamylase (glucan-1,4-alpha-glucosidase), GH15 family [Micromonospora phaseoli]|uniref:Glucoamylase (Glucan-1,4-alpha-glucosidase), GH15 family n=1 Tax=Micromonospora phaseoli TaxID=1144548 RepID=A0A1H6TZR4_9ACTN|nr:glycoside hydrolase family 15 protein [Micromonospora phaseoli]PZV98813.1 GH15 family glucan-1,4-alpha-glucosidase [Micromonospora phaseoli]GIJ76436.1 glucoamylase [Micromonospora phaseoli]SEI85618.1 Glucoamylase (glucan-1,4-alpha-glucosidase), GH15 family [Micromonospora phaseoli]
MDSGRIGEHGFLANGRSAVLVDRAGSVNWWCPQRFDGPSVFARLLDDDAGHWSIRPAGHFTTERSYVEGTLVLRTVFATGHGRMALTDALALEPGARGHDIGLRSPHVLARFVEGLAGEVPVRLHYRPRFEYGRVTAYLNDHNGIIDASAGACRLSLRGDVPLSCHQGDATANFTVRAGETYRFTLGHAPTYDSGPPALPDADQVITNAVAGWRSWADLHHDQYDGLFGDQVRHSAIVLQGMTYQPSGAIIAAATTSLPEQPGGARNYDYRFVWLRDFSLTLQALWRAACPDEVDRHFAWVAHATGRISDAPVPIMYGVQGERDLTEHHLDHLTGYAHSQPVTVGNDAWKQRQSDVLGEVLDAAWLMRHYLDPMTPDVRQLLHDLADQAVLDWHRPDSGMWESRDTERHYVSSKVQCWTALDRAVRFGRRLGDQSDVARWAAARDDIRNAVLTRGWNDRLGTFTGAFDSDHLDASVLIMPLVGFLPADDPRMRSTVRVVERELSHKGLLRRWDGDPAGFVICSFWLVTCLALAGEVERAERLFRQLAGRANDLGLFAEQIDPATGAHLGNFPQAFSHIGLINAAGRLSEAVYRRDAADKPRHPVPAGTGGTEGAPR